MIGYRFVGISPSYDIKRMLLFFFCKHLTKVPNWTSSLSSKLLEYTRERSFFSVMEKEVSFRAEKR